MNPSKRFFRIFSGSSAALVALGGLALSANAQQSNDDVRAVVAQMMSDAETRSSLLAGGDAGHDGKFFIAGDGFRLNVGGGMQLRYLLNFRDENVAPADDFSNGFQTSRTRLNFGGNVHDKWQYFIEAEFKGMGDSTVNNVFRLLDAYVGYKFDNGVVLNWGQVKAPIIREDMIGDFKQLAITRAPSTDILRHDRIKGIWITYQQEDWRTFWTFNSGAATPNTDFNATNNADYAFSGRFEFKCAGDWKQFADFTSPRGSEFGCLFGIAAHYQGPHNTPAFGDVDTSIFLYTADIGLEGDGWNLFGAFIGRHTERDSFAGDTEFDDFSFNIQGGVMLCEKGELFARYDALILDDSRGTMEDYFSFVTVGMNYYFAGHAAKFTGDVLISVEKTNPDLTSTVSAYPSTSQALLGETEEGEVALRFQMQLLF